MTTEEALSKLAPLIPETVAAWRANLPLLDPSTRHLLEQHIYLKALELLGPGWSSRLLLPPPPKASSEGPLHLGDVSYPGGSASFGLEPSELLQGLGVFGRSGAGKTNVVFLLLDQIEDWGIPYLFLDWKKTARHRRPRHGNPIQLFTPGTTLAPFTFNPFIPPPGLETRAYVTLLVDALAAAYTLGDGAKSLLHGAMSKAYAQASGSWPRLDDVLSQLEGHRVKGRAIGWMATASRALRSLSFSDPLEGATDQAAMVSALTKRSTILELDALDLNAKQFLIPLLLLWLFHQRMQQPTREKLEIVIILEEAHHLLYRQEQRSHETLINRMLRQSRELGIGMVVVDQHPHLISSAALGNLYATICLNLREPSDRSRAASLSNLADADRHHLGLLPVGTGIVKLQDRWPHPFLVRFPDAKVAKGSMTDEAFRSRRSGPTRSASQAAERSSRPRVRSVRASHGVGSREAWRLLSDVLRHPTDGVRARYTRLGLSADRGGRAKEVLLDAGLLQANRVRTGRTWRLALGPTPLARSRLRLQGSPGAESLEHEFYKHLCAEELRAAGYLVELEARRVGGRVDIQATSNQERLAVEVETGKSEIVRNVRNCLRSRYGQVLVVATNDEAMRIATSRLAREGLLESGRVEVRLRTTGQPGRATPAPS